MTEEEKREEIEKFIQAVKDGRPPETTESSYEYQMFETMKKSYIEFIMMWETWRKKRGIQ